jgi:drug/metabolite transporter (DMT)-like permease
MLLSAVFSSIMGCFLKLVSDTGTPSTEMVFYRAIFQGIFVFIYMLRARADVNDEESKLMIAMPLGKSRNEISIVIGRGLLGGLNFIMKSYSMIALPLGDAITLFSLHPIITVFMAWLFLGETIRNTHIFAAFTTITGAVLMLGPAFLFNDRDIEEENINKLGYLTAILSSFCAAGVLVLIRKAGKLGVYTSQLLFSFTVFGGGLALFVGMTIGVEVEGKWILPLTTRSFWLIFGMCGIGSIAQLLKNYAGRITPAGLGSIARSSDIFWGYILEVLVFGTIPSWTTVLGVLLILIALSTVAYEKVQEERAEITEQLTESTLETGYKNIEELPHEKGIQA